MFSSRFFSKCNRLQLRRLIFTNQSAVVKDNILTSALPDIVLPNCSVTEYIFNEIPKYENYTAAECALTKRKYTYGELAKKSLNLSKALRKKLKLDEGDVVAVLLPNVPEYSIVLLGVLGARLIATPINPNYTVDEIRRQLKDSSAKAIVTLADAAPVVKKAVETLGEKIHILVLKTDKNQSTPNGAIDLSEFMTNDLDFPNIPPPDPHSVALLPYSSGTTGLPKGVQLTHFNIVANISQHYCPDIDYLRSASDLQENVLAVLPFFHIYGLQVMAISMLTRGVNLVMMPKFTPENYISTLRDYPISLIPAVPHMLLFLTKHEGVKKEYMANLRNILCGAAPLGAKDEMKFLEKFGDHIDLFQVYGMTEASPLVSIVHKKVKTELGDKTQGSIGRLVPNTEGKVVDTEDPENKPLPPNIPGELLIKGPQVMKGYLNKPQETRNTITNDGWLRTGDLVYYTDDGLMFVSDRIKELIKVKGFPVAPAELEDILRSIPGVADAAVIGIDDERNGQIPRAYITPQEGITLNGDEIQKIFSGRVASYKQLKGGISFVSEIPRNPSGKILRRLIQEQYKNQII